MIDLKEILEITKNMLEFKKLTIDDIIDNIDYFCSCGFHMSDYSAAFKFMWQEYFTEYYAKVENCLVFKEYFQGSVYFHYPISGCSEEN